MLSIVIQKVDLVHLFDHVHFSFADQTMNFEDFERKINSSKCNEWCV